MNHYICSLLLAVLFYTTGMTQPAIPESIKANIRARVDNQANKNIIVGTIDKKGKHYYSYGHVSAKHKIAPKKYTVYEIGSISKVFTGLALALAVESGKVKLSDSLAAFTPDTLEIPSHSGGVIQLLDLSNHHSGLPRMPNNMRRSDPENPYVDYSSSDLWGFLSTHTPQRAPKESYEYSNLGAGLLGQILADQAGMTYGELIQTQICDPLGLANTGLVLNEDQKLRLSPGHRGNKVVKNWDFDALAGAGGLKSTASDMLDFLKFILEYENTPLQAAMRLSQEKTMDLEKGKSAIALGWHMIFQDNKVLYWHNGATGGYSSFLGFNKKTKRGIVVLTNSNNKIDDIGLHFLDRDFPLKEIKEVVKVKDKVLNSYVGQYQLTPQLQFDISKENLQLHVQLTGQPAFEIYPESESKFFLRVVEAQISFNKNEEGEVESLTLHQGGRDQVAKKVE